MPLLNVRSDRLSPRMPGLAQAAYYVLSGAWPLLSYRSFELVSGPKREPWLVKMVGLLTVVIGAVLARDPGGRSPQTRALAVGTAGAYAVIDIWYAAVRRRISPVYLLDAAAELAFVAAWLARGR